ncbi:hypothetical protein [Polaromonas sp.]|uniref:hypothetical protein n=1 Tax=Polaromonas sp. TaxID=1869339 RepID=UPI00356AF713
MSLSSFFSRAHSRVSGSAGSSSRRSEPWLLPEATTLALPCSGQNSAAFGLLTSGKSNSLAELPETKRLVAQTTIDSLFAGEWFDICKVDSLVQITDTPKNSAAYRLLRPLHCVHYDKMPRELLEQIPHLVRECLTPAPPRNCQATAAALDGVEFHHG